MNNESDFLTFIAIAVYIACVIAWITHIVACIKTASWILLILGAFFFPVGIVHGVMVWFGAN